MSNVRFYRVSEMPEFGAKHQGIFVHLTTEYSYSGRTYKAGLWFGGATGWEYLTNDTTPESITAAIEALDVNGYAQATMNTNVVNGDKTDSKLTILGIKEDNGIISNDSTKDVNIAIEGIYNENNNKIATQSTVTNAIGNLKTTETIQAVTFNTAEIGGNTTLTFNGVKEENGLIAQGNGTGTFVVGDAKLKIQIGSAEAYNVFSANAQANSTIQLNGDVFKKEKDVISVITQTPVTSNNKLVTEKDVANLARAMHYKGTVSSLQEFQNKLADSDAEEAGDVYIATGSFTHNDNVIENGDMIVFNSASEYTVVQSNLTLGTKSAQIAKNDGDLADGKLVVATLKGIRTSNIDGNVFEDVNNTRTLGIDNVIRDSFNENLYHGITISDAFKVINKDFSKTINISSTNRSIEIAKNGDTGVMVDLVWNTNIE